MIILFIGRNRELDTLNEAYLSDRFEFVVLYGRRRVGKTALLSEFVKDKDAIYFTGVETTYKQNLSNLSNAIHIFETGMPGSGGIYSTFQDALSRIFQIAQERRVALIVDEYPYVAKAAPELASTLQMLIDENKDSTNLMLVLCGSSMSYMEDEVLAYKSPLYGRRTAQIHLQAFDFFEVCDYFSDFSDLDKANLYGIFGGTPQYLTQVDRSKSVPENISNTYLNPMSFMFEEPVNLLKQELREPTIYNAIISAIANGCTQMNEISNLTGESTSTCSSYIKNLISLGIVEKEMPYLSAYKRKSLYRIGDNMFRFWFRFVQPNLSLITRGIADEVLKTIEIELSSYMGFVFEDICKQYLWRLRRNGECPVSFADIGRWWGTDKKTKSQVEIDIVAKSKSEYLIGECKWRNDLTQLSDLKKLMEKAEIFDDPMAHFYLFSKSGFTKGCIDFAENDKHIHLVTYKDICKLI